MKKYAGMLMALMLTMFSVIGFAQEYYTLPEIREQAEAGWHETYTDKYGRTVQVDIDIDVFGEERAPVLEVGYPDYVEYRDTKNNPYQTVMDVRKHGGQRTHFFVKFGEKVDLDKAYGVDIGSDMTLREVYDYLRELLEEQGIPAQDFLYDQPWTFEMLCNTSQATGEVLSTPFYFVRLWPTLHGLPILTHALNGTKKPGWPWYCAELLFMMIDRESYQLGVDTLVERKMLAEDIPLCSLEQVIRNLEEEVEAGYIQKVYSLRFGYSLFNDPAIQSKSPVSAYDVDCFYVVPSWIVECIFAEKPKETVLDSAAEDIDEHAYAKMITINAQTGKMLDPFDKSKYGFADGDYKGFISWEDIR